jgi:hypothetical protein
MPRTTTPIQRVKPTSAPARMAKPQARPVGFQPSAPPAAPRMATQVRAANFTAPGSSRLTMSQAVSQISVNTNPVITATAHASNCCCVACTGLQCLDRTRFFSGQLLTDADLNNEQSYMLAKNRLHNRYLNGWGAVCGLQVTCSECAGWVNINPGYAIDPCGNDIIVCKAQSFNVLQAIQACCTPPSQTNCQPLRYTPPATCLDAPQKWCITVQYQEQPSQLVAPLQNVTNTSCGCGGSTKGCGCGCGGAAKSSCGCGGGAQSGGGCGCNGNSSAATTSSSSVSCQATRIIEGFQFGISSCSSDEKAGAQPGTLLYQAEQCYSSIAQLVLQAPNNLDTLWNQGNQQGVYQAVCNYVVNLQQYFAQNQTLTDCALLDKLNAISVPALNANSTLGTYQAIRIEVLLILVEAFFDCVCLSLVPQCPPAACDNRVPLACVTIQNGVIQDICHFSCRKQLIGVTALNYWFEPIFQAFSTALSDAAAKFCCNERDSQTGRLFSNNTAFSAENMTSAGFTNSAMFTRTMSSFIAQKMGATMVNAANPNLRAVDMRPYIGQPLETVQSGLAQQGWSKTKLADNQTGSSPFDVQSVDQDPSWNMAAITSASQFAPSAVSSGQPLTLYVQGQSVVGIEVTSQTRALQLQIDSLNSTIGTLQSQLTSMQAQVSQQPAAPSAQAPDASAKPGKKK